MVPLRHFSILIAIACIVVPASFAFAEAHGAAQTVLTVEVVNETENGTPVTGDPVYVQMYDHGQPLPVLEGKVGADGKAVFENVPTGDKIGAVASAKHSNMMFRADPIALVAIKNSFSARVQVYDVSTDKSALSIQTHHLMVKAEGDTLVFTEYMQIANSSTMAISSSDDGGEKAGAVVEVRLPNGYKDFKSLDYFVEDALVFTDEGFYDTMAVPPGEFHVSFSYALDVTSETMDISKVVTLPTSKLVIFAELGAGELKGLGEARSMASSAAGAEVSYYTVSDISAGKEIAFKIAGLTPKAFRMPTWAILAGVFAAVMAIVVWRMLPAKS